jgi:hypothetical protein|nr:MAG TPA: nucelotide kinase [Caudoviricetes sp.]
MICNKDVEGGKAFWTAVMASRIVLPNGAEAERLKSASPWKERTLSSDNISHPPHYADGWSNGAEVIDLTEHLSFCAGNVVKYVCRAGRKDPGKHVEDLKKARWYIDREIERVKGQ